MTRLQQAIYSDLFKNGPSTARDIAERIGETTRAVTTSLCFGRGAGAFNDGSVIYLWPDGGACMHHPKGPLTWGLGDTPNIEGACPDEEDAP